jgi:hypothetical protein
MMKFRDAGIYVVVNLGGEIRGFYEPLATWDTLMLRRYTAIIDSFAEFSNLLGFHIATTVESLPFSKAAVRDLKDHMQFSGYRAIPIGLTHWMAILPRFWGTSPAVGAKFRWTSSCTN